MAEPVIAQESPFGIDVEEGKSYWWCACGRSENQPFCDGSHKGTGIEPVQFEVEEKRRRAYCQCKHAGEPVFCDGSHSSLE